MIIIDKFKGVIRNLIFAWQSRLLIHRVYLIVMVYMLTLAIQLIETTDMTLCTDNSVIHIKNLVTLTADKIVMEEAITILFEQVFGTLMGGVQMLTRTITF